MSRKSSDHIDFDDLVPSPQERKREKRRRRRQNVAARAAISAWALDEAGRWEAEAKRLALECLRLQRASYCSPLTPAQELARQALMMQDANPIPSEEDCKRFLGLTMFHWMMAPVELLEVFDLHQAVNMWTKQLETDARSSGEKSCAGARWQ
ncbi:hypothetical protein [Azorhizobium doebereinerae]|uniref:hypothetical protein n=1 Tax=Azorhizobium doebereinerae TaxID=281091 RepID=UPI0004014FE2|nr:hypothetical protein [Azorhizobium doebereinerae]